MNWWVLLLHGLVWTVVTGVGLWLFCTVSVKRQSKLAGACLLVGASLGHFVGGSVFAYLVDPTRWEEYWYWLWSETYPGFAFGGMLAGWCFGWMVFLSVRVVQTLHGASKVAVEDSNKDQRSA